MLYQEAWRRRFGSPAEREDELIKVRAVIGWRSTEHFRFSPILPLRGEAKAASPGLLVKRRSPSAAALHIKNRLDLRCV